MPVRLLFPLHMPPRLISFFTSPAYRAFDDRRLCRVAEGATDLTLLARPFPFPFAFVCYLTCTPSRFRLLCLLSIHSPPSCNLFLLRVLFRLFSEIK